LQAAPRVKDPHTAEILVRIACGIFDDLTQARPLKYRLGVSPEPVTAYATAALVVDLVRNLGGNDSSPRALATAGAYAAIIHRQVVEAGAPRAEADSAAVALLDRLLPSG
jgi:hypothetical protein